MEHFYDPSNYVIMMDTGKAKEYIRSVTRSIENFPRQGIIFRDLTTVFLDEKGWALSLELLAEKICNGKGRCFDKLAGVEARGFVLAGGLAAKLGGGIVMIRKPGKLPHKTISKSYQLEYGEDALEVHVDAIRKGEEIVLVDDLLATGGTAEAACKLIEELGGVVKKILFLVELPELEGRKRLDCYQVESVVTFEGH